MVHSARGRFVVSDYDAWAEVWSTHHEGGSAEGGAAKGLNAGIDQEGGGNRAISTLAQAITDGLTTAHEVPTQAAPPSSPAPRPSVVFGGPL